MTPRIHLARRSASARLLITKNRTLKERNLRRRRDVEKIPAYCYDECYVENIIAEEELTQ